MRSSHRTAPALLPAFACLCIAGAVSAEPPETATPPMTWNTTYASRYDFEGIDYSAGRPVFQPAASASARGFTAGIWGNVDQTRGRLDEVDATMQREFERGALSGAVGYEYLRFPHRAGWAPTHEATLDLALAAPLSPSLSVHWDVDAGAGRYWTLGLARECGL